MPYAKKEDRLANNAKRVARNKALVSAAKNGPCTDCGIQLPPECMDLDHVRGEFKFWIANGHWTYAPATVQAEIDKCDLRCPNCHALRHYRQDGRRGVTKAQRAVMEQQAD